MKLEDVVLVNEGPALDAPRHVYIFRNRISACEYLEPIDVAAGEYHATTAEGFPLEVRTDGKKVWLVELSASPWDPAVVRLLLEHTLKAVHRAGRYKEVTPSEGIERLIEAIGFSR